MFLPLWLRAALLGNCLQWLNLSLVVHWWLVWFWLSWLLLWACNPKGTVWKSRSKEMYEVILSWWVNIWMEFLDNVSFKKTSKISLHPSMNNHFLFSTVICSLYLWIHLTHHGITWSFSLKWTGRFLGSYSSFYYFHQYLAQCLVHRKNLIHIF